MAGVDRAADGGGPAAAVRDRGVAGRPRRAGGRAGERGSVAGQRGVGDVLRAVLGVAGPQRRGLRGSGARAGALRRAAGSGALHGRQGPDRGADGAGAGRAGSREKAIVADYLRSHEQLSADSGDVGWITCDHRGTDHGLAGACAGAVRERRGLLAGPRGER